MTDHPKISVENLVVSVLGDDGNQRVIVENVSFKLNEGKVLALIGESGSGKTTIALSIMGYTRQGTKITGGKIIYNDATIITDLDESQIAKLRGNKIAYVAQSAASAFNPSRTIISQVIEPLLIHKTISRKDAETKAIKLFKKLSLPFAESIGYRYPHQVSGGQLQRLMAAMALITDPEIVIFDEPTTALDVTTQVGVLKAFKAAIQDQKVTAIYVSHDLAVVSQIADEIVVLQNGKMVEQNDAQTILNTPQEEYTKNLIAAIKPKYLNTKANNPNAILEVKNIFAGYGSMKNGIPKSIILNDISFAIGRGETIGIIGESGSGKSTLARVIAGLVPQYSGQVILDNKILSSKFDKRPIDDLRKVQIVFQNADIALNPAHSVYDTLARPLKFFHKLDNDQLKIRIGQLLEYTKLPAKIANQNIMELSGGQKQRINLARALAANPEILICDEVTSALDTIVASAILDLIEELRKELNLATIFISHDISAVRAFCDQILVLHKGIAVELARRDDFENSTHHQYTQNLINSVPKMEKNWLENTAPIEEIQ